jgi:hypothetical protein
MRSAAIFAPPPPPPPPPPADAREMPFRSIRRRSFPWQRARKALLYLALAPIGLWLLYVVVGNIMLGTGLVARLVSYNPEAANMYYDSAWTYWPGVAYVKNFRISGSDTVLQWVVGVDEARVDVRMLDLFDRKFHAKSVKGKGYVLRVALRVDPKVAEGVEAQALPAVRGFTNPPVTLAGPFEEVTDENYYLWTAHLEDIDEGRVRGSFFFKPLRVVQVGPTVLELTSGELHVADKIAARLAASIDITMNPIDPRIITGPNALSTTGLHLTLDAQTPGLEFLNIHMDPGGPRFEDGSGEIRADLFLNRGLLEPASFLSYATSNLAVETPDARVTARGSVDIHVSDKAGPDRARITTRLQKVTVARPEKNLQPALAENVSVEVRAPYLHLIEPLPKTSASINVPAAVLPDLQWLNTKNTKNTKDAPPERPVFEGGAAFFRGKVEVDPEGRATGAVRTLLKKVSMHWKHTVLKGEGSADIAIGSADPLGMEMALGRSRVEVKDIVIKHRDETFPAWWAKVDIDKASISRNSAALSLRIQTKDAQPAVGLLDAEDVIPGWAAGLLTMEGLTASANLTKRGDDIDFTLTRAKGGSLDIRGRLLAPGVGPLEGAFVVSNGPVLTVGILIDRDGVGVRPFAGDDWLKEKSAELGR